MKKREDTADPKLEKITDHRPHCALHIDSASLNKRIIDVSPIGIFTTDLGGEVTSVNDAFRRITGLSRDEVLGKHFTKLPVVIPSIISRSISLLNDTLAQERPATAIFRFRRRDGTLRWGEIMSVPIQSKGNIYGLLFLLHDVTGRETERDILTKRCAHLEGTVAKLTEDIAALKEKFHAETRRHRMTEEALDESEERYRSAMQQSVDAIYLLDPETKRVLEANTAFLDLLGYSAEEVKNLLLYDFIAHNHEEIDVYLHKIIADGFLGIGDRKWRHKNGTLVDVQVSANVIRRGRKKSLFIIARDMTNRIEAEREKEKLQQQLFESQKMEAIGHLAGGVAHEFKNLLSAILGNVLYLRKLDESSTKNHLDECLSDIEKAAYRGTDVSSHLLGFARRGDFVEENVDVSSVIREVVRVLDRTFDRTITIETDVQQSLEVIGDKTQIHQALMNLCINARDAMTGVGRIVITAQGKIFSEADAPFPGAHAHPSWVVISIDDTGQGMDEQTRNRVFEPFFTTKKDGEGTGLGLAMVHGMVQKYKGHIMVRSQLGIGSTFTMYLPAAQFRTVVRKKPKTTMSGSGLILLVDDESLVRRATKRLLGILGYKVICAENGKKALALYEEKQGEVSAVLLDLVMPIMGGAETHRRLRQLNSDVKVLVMSGYEEGHQLAEILADGVQGFLRKPFDCHELGTALAEVMGSDITEKAGLE